MVLRLASYTFDHISNAMEMSTLPAVVSRLNAEQPDQVRDRRARGDTDQVERRGRSWPPGAR